MTRYDVLSCYYNERDVNLLFRYDCIKSLLRLLLWLVSIALICWTLLWYWGDMRGPEHLISRRLANLPFVLWQVSSALLPNRFSFSALIHC